MPIYPFSRQSLLAMQTLGRKTGQPRLTPMGYVRLGDRVLVVAEHGTRADWYLNARAAGSVRVLYRGRWRTATVAATDDDPRTVLALMPSRTIAAFNRALWHRPRVVEIGFIEGSEPAE
ncbi:MAG: nitroreductase/quinone reductase family protein [Actinomycetota bacterium]